MPIEAMAHLGERQHVDPFGEHEHLRARVAKVADERRELFDLRVLSFDPDSVARTAARKQRRLEPLLLLRREGPPLREGEELRRLLPLLCVHRRHRRRERHVARLLRQSGKVGEDVFFLATKHDRRDALAESAEVFDPDHS
jgi:hypothetical protein